MQEHSSAEPPLTKIRVPGEGPAWLECSNEACALGLALHGIVRALKKKKKKLWERIEIILIQPHLNAQQKKGWGNHIACISHYKSSSKEAFQNPCHWYSPSHIHLMLPHLTACSYCTSQPRIWSSRRVSSEQSHSLIAMLCWRTWQEEKLHLNKPVLAQETYLL